MDLSAVIGENLRRIRLERNLSLGQLAALSHVSKVMLSQIEKGAGNPTVNTVWKIADALQLPYTALLERNVDGGAEVRGGDLPAQALDDGRGELRCYYHHAQDRNFELFQMSLQPGGVHVSQGHRERTEEYALVLSGTGRITLDDGDHILHAGDAISFRSDRLHRYCNDGGGELRLMILNDYR